MTSPSTTDQVSRAFIYFWSRLDETSSARGLITLIALIFGWQMDPVNLQNYVAGALALSAAMKTFLPDLWSDLRKKYPDALPPQ